MKMTKEEKVKNEQLKAMARSILQGRNKNLAIGKKEVLILHIGGSENAKYWL